nr:unnamed protein product [Spirometra erinaceieuropaei]
MSNGSQRRRLRDESSSATLQEAKSETRFSKQDQLEEVGTSCTFSWSGRLKAERWDAGVAFAIRNVIAGRLPCLPRGSNDRPMSLRLHLRGGDLTTIFSVSRTHVEDSRPF